MYLKIFKTLSVFSVGLIFYTQSSFAAPNCTEEKSCGGGQSYCKSGTQKGKCHDASNPTLFYESASCTTCGGAIAPLGPLSPLPKPLAK
jgi:hypothetical protein